MYGRSELLQTATRRLLPIMAAGFSIIGMHSHGSQAGGGVKDATTQPLLQVPYTMPADGQLTLGLFDQSNRLLRWIVQDEYRRAGRNSQGWDGLDQWGQQVPAGTYNLKAVYHDPISLDYLLTVANPGTPPWPTPDDKGDWLSDEATPQAVATDGQWIFLAAPGSENGCSVIALDEEGHRQWGVKESFNPRAVSIACAGDYLYILYAGPEITDKAPMYTGSNAIGRALLLCLDKKSGQPAKFSTQTPLLKVTTWRYRDAVSYLWDLRNSKSFSPFTYGGQPRYFNLDIGESTDALGIAVTGEKIHISLPYENELLELDAETGQPAGAAIPIASPAGLCATDDHTLLAVSGSKVVRIDLPSGKMTPFISDNLVAPDSIAVNRGGHVYVSDWGNSFQVKVFDRDGKFVRTIGTPGGRAWIGKWNPNGMLVPRGIAVTDENELWVAEDDGSPKRISVWNGETGDFLRDYIGPAPYGGGTHFWINPKDSTEVHAEGTRFHIDYAQKTWTPEDIDYRKGSQDTPFTPNGHDLTGRQVRILYHNNDEYGVFTTGPRQLSILQRRGDIYQPVAALGSFPYDPQRSLTPDSDSIFAWDSDIMWHVFPHYYPSFFAGHMENNFSWSDLNGDGRVQPNEMQWQEAPDHPRYVPGTQASWCPTWNLDLAPDFTAYFPEQFEDKLVIMKLPPRGWTSAGAPIYVAADAKPVIFLPASRKIQSLHVSSDNRLILAYDYEYHGADARDAIECFDLAGHSLWSFAMPTRAEGQAVHANCVAYDYNVPGIGDVVCTWAYHGSQKVYFFTTDGLYIGTALDETRLGPTATWSESSRYFYQTPDGVPYLINGANQQEHILKVNGLTQGGRFSGTFAFSPEEASKAAAARTLPKPATMPRPVVGITWLESLPKMDGNLSDWDMNLGVKMKSGSRGAEISLGRDDSNLYVACRVTEPTAPWVNGGTDWRQLFTTGDCVDLMLAANPEAAAHRREAASGDERLLFSTFQGQPIAVLYQPMVPGTTAPLHFGSAQIDRVTRLDSARIATRQDPGQKSYTMEASVPLRDLSIDPKETGQLLGDVGVIFADESGHNRAQRLYYYGGSTESVSDVPTEAKLHPDEWGAIHFPLGPNLLHNGGFEEPLVDSADRESDGWFILHHDGGSTVSLSSESPHSGGHALLMQTTSPPQVPTSEYQDPNYGAFIKSFNHGTGGGHAEIQQKVPVIAGHRYALRYFFHGTDFQEERKDTGLPRGYISFASRIDWQCKEMPGVPPLGAGETKVAPSDWQEVTDKFGGFDLPRTALAPPGAVSARIHFELITNAENHRPRVFLDDVEFVDEAQKLGP